MWEVIHHPKAAAEASRSVRCYNRGRSGLGADFYAALDTAVSQLQRQPTLFPADPDGVRSWRLHRPGYWRPRVSD